MKTWWQKHWETIAITFCLVAVLAVLALSAWEWIVDMNGVR